MNVFFNKSILENEIIAVLVIDNAEDAVAAAESLLSGGVHAMELAFRTPAALEALYKIKENVPEMIAGVGTIITPEQVNQAADANADFAVAPGLSPDVVIEAKKRKLPFAPGIATPSEIEKALGLGCNVLKFFPAEPIGGLKYLKSINAPYAHLKLKYVPLGGINVDNMGHYLKESFISAVGGSWIANRKLILQRDWKAITENARHASQIAEQIREVSVL